MACFLVPMGEAVVTTVVQKVVEKQEEKKGDESEKAGARWSQRLGWLNKLLWGGTLLLALEHIWHGEVIFRPPFLTAMENPANISTMLREMATVGGAMAITVTIAWGIMVMVVELRTRGVSEAKETVVSRGE